VGLPLCGRPKKIAQWKAAVRISQRVPIGMVFYRGRPAVVSYGVAKALDPRVPTFEITRVSPQLIIRHLSKPFADMTEGIFALAS